MSGKDDNGIEAANAPHSPQEKAKAPRRVENMRRINREGLAGPGGRRVTTGDYALAARWKAGVSPESPLYPIIRGNRDKFLADLGGEGNASAKEAQLCEFLGFQQLRYGDLLAKYTMAKGMSRRELLEFNQAATRLELAFTQIADKLGLPRRLKDVDREIVIKKFAEAPPPERQEPPGE